MVGTHEGLNHLELPPRARRIHYGNPTTTFGRGTTSACAENTFGGFHDPLCEGNYLRVRGEYSPYHSARE